MSVGTIFVRDWARGKSSPRWAGFNRELFRTVYSVHSTLIQPCEAEVNQRDQHISLATVSFQELIAIDLQLNAPSRKPAQPLAKVAQWAVSLLLALGVLLLSLCAAGIDLHGLFHEDACEASHECAVTLFAHGHIDLADTAAEFVVRPTAVTLFPQFVGRSFISAPDFLFLPGRAPPVFS